MTSFGFISQNNRDMTKSQNDKITILFTVNCANYEPGLKVLSTPKIAKDFIIIKENESLKNIL
jgi:hypothetical protein